MLPDRSGVTLLLALTTACAPPASPPAYQPRTRAVTVTTVPLLVRESQRVFPFLKESFAPGGVLAGKEVYAFVPSTITVVAGDTVVFSFVNPEDDLHNFVLGTGELNVALPGERTTRAIYVATHAGIMRFACTVPGHAPMMAGELVVLAPGALGRR